MNRQRALAYAVATAAIAVVLIAAIGLTVGYGRGEAGAVTGSAVAGVQANSFVDTGNAGSPAAAVRLEANEHGDDEGDREHEDSEYEHEDGEHHGVGSFEDD